MYEIKLFKYTVFWLDGKREVIEGEILGDTWEQMAYVDRLVEIGELKEVPQGDCAGQHRIFYVPGNR